MSTAILDELESLRKSLEGPRQNGNEREYVDAKNIIRGYAHALDSAETSVERLTNVLDKTNHGYNSVDAALKSMTNVQKLNTESNIQELKRLVEAKERSLESLRGALASIKASSESKLNRLQQQLTQAREEITDLKNDLETETKRRSDAEEQCRMLSSEARKREKEQSHREQELWDALQRAEKDRDRVLLELETETTVHEQTRSEVATLRQTVEEERKKSKEADKLQRVIKEERAHFANAKKWLKAELRSRNEMEKLLTTVQDMTHCSSPELRPAESEEDTDIPCPTGDPGQKMTQIGVALQAQLHSTRRQLARALKKKEP